MGILARHGYELTPRADEADVLVVNTCSFIEPGAAGVGGHHPRDGRTQKIWPRAAADRGRMPGRALSRRDPRADSGSGRGDRHRRSRAHSRSGARRAAARSPAAAPAFLYHDATPRVLSTPRHAAYIKIAEGCDHPCTFCIIPQLRGKFRSRRFESVVREAENLAAAGVREVTLIGQDTTSYGEDLGLRDGLAALLARLADVEGLAWVRFLYAYPNRVTQRLLDTLAAHPRLVKYMDMPLQHASRNVLARMKRGSNGDAFLRLIERIRATIPGVMLRTSFIVGFPGETRADFRELCDFVRAAEFDWMGVFAYSDVDNAAQLRAGRESRRRNHRRAARSPDGHATAHFRASPAALRGPETARAGRRPVEGHRTRLGGAARKAWRRKSTARSI